MHLFDTHGWNDTQPRKRLSQRLLLANEVLQDCSIARLHYSDSKSAEYRKDDGATTKPLSNRKALRRNSAFSSSLRDLMNRISLNDQAHLKSEKITPVANRGLRKSENVEFPPEDNIQWTHLLFAISLIAISVVLASFRRLKRPQEPESHGGNIFFSANLNVLGFRLCSNAFVFLWALFHKMLLMEVRRRLWRIASKVAKSLLKCISVTNHPYLSSVGTKYIPRWIRRGLTKLFMKKVKKNVNTYVKDALEDGIAAGEMSSIFLTVRNAWSLSLAQEYFIGKALRVAKQLIRTLLIIEFKRKIWRYLFRQLKKVFSFVVSHEYFLLNSLHIPQWIKRGAKKLFKKNVNSAVKGCLSYGRDEVMSAINEFLCSSLDDESAKEFTCSLSFSFGFSWAEWDLWDSVQTFWGQVIN